MANRRQSRPAAYVLGVLVALSAFGGCTEVVPDVPRLRITNSSATRATRLTVLFPMDQIEFGDVAPGATTVYRHVPNGVYRYAAYRLEVDGQTVTVPVLDWVGEEPIDGAAFTYTITVDPSRPLLQIVRLISVTKDE
jgi:hypothetical protein